MNGTEYNYYYFFFKQQIQPKYLFGEKNYNATSNNFVLYHVVTQPLSLLSVLQQLYQIQQVTMPAGQELSQPMFIQSTNQTVDAQVTQVSTD